MADERTGTTDSGLLAAAMAEPLHPRASTRRKIVYGVLGIAVLAFPWVFEADNPYSVHLMITFFMFALMAQSWNILAGYCGQISLGHAAFFGIGARTFVERILHLVKPVVQLRQPGAQYGFVMVCVQHQALPPIE